MATKEAVDLPAPELVHAAAAPGQPDRIRYSSTIGAWAANLLRAAASQPPVPGATARQPTVVATSSGVKLVFASTAFPEVRPQGVLAAAKLLEIAVSRAVGEPAGPFPVFVDAASGAPGLLVLHKDVPLLLAAAFPAEELDASATAIGRTAADSKHWEGWARKVKAELAKRPAAAAPKKRARVGSPPPAAAAAATDTSPVFFWLIDELSNPHRVFSNWYPAPFVDPTQSPPVRYANVEQYMMAAKALVFRNTNPAANDSVRAGIMATTDPGTIKALGRKVQGFGPGLWDAPSKNAVFNACYLKFKQNPALATLLLSTGDRPLAEAAPNDAVWGIGMSAKDAAGLDPKHWKGENRLGTILTRVRDQLRREAAGAPPPALRPVVPIDFPAPVPPPLPVRAGTGTVRRATTAGAARGGGRSGSAARGRRRAPQSRAPGRRAA